MTSEEARKRAIWILGNLVHYRHGGGHERADIDFLTTELVSIIGIVGKDGFDRGAEAARIRAGGSVPGGGRGK